jgi:RNA polymerase sigma-70 factor (ECF subfamily)
VTECPDTQPAPGAADAAGLAAAARDDTRAFEELYERHVAVVYRYCFSRLGDREAAEDATGDVFLKALQGMEDFRGGAVAAWLIVIARNTVVDAVRRRRLTVAVEEPPEPVDPSPRPEDHAVVADERESLRAAIARLSEDQRAVLELQLAGWRGPEIAEALGKSPDAVKMLRLRAVRQLRVLLADGDARAAKERTDG